MTKGSPTLVDILQLRAALHPQKLAFRFLHDGEITEQLLTYEELDRKARSVGALLQSSVSSGDRVILLFQPGLDFIISFFGCLYAKVTAVPVYPPHPARLEISLPFIRQISADTKAAAFLLSPLLHDSMIKQNSIGSGFAGIKMVVLNTNYHAIDEEQWQPPDIAGEDIAFLQYTSGSTAAPKGVMIRHKNLLHNLSLIEKSFGVTKEDQGIFWLPPYHDMGLIGGILQPVYSGATFTLMPHMMFLQRPIRWLQAISRFKATISGGPNFAYQQCLKKIKPEQREELHLESWRVAFNGAEPIYYKTLLQFAEHFSSSGFRMESFATCYGLAESTLFVAGGAKGRSPLIKNFSISGTRKNIVVEAVDTTENIQTLVSCGTLHSDQKIAIVNQETYEPCQPGEIGEIWISGNSVADGYWNKPAETNFAFGAQLSVEEEKYLRTGDLGFLHSNELYVTGRLTDLIISQGKNHYSQDIERSVEASHPSVRPSGCAAFSIQNEEDEQLIIVAELEHTAYGKEEEICAAIRKSVSENHGLKVHKIRLTSPGKIPRTTSGKIKHFLCKQHFLEGQFKENEAI